jgi:hypothetical protein
MPALQVVQNPVTTDFLKHFNKFRKSPSFEGRKSAFDEIIKMMLSKESRDVLVKSGFLTTEVMLLFRTYKEKPYLFSVEIKTFEVTLTPNGFSFPQPAENLPA